MRKVRKALKPVSLLMAIFMLVLCTPCQTVLARMIPTETVLDAARVDAARTQVSTFLARQDVVDVLVSQGIDPAEATARIAGLSDAEVVRLADRIEQLPAGGDTFATIVIASIVIFVILLITDIMGFTDIFPFVKKKRI
jgi:cobalamin biosynthesis protein CobD/CbiB